MQAVENISSNIVFYATYILYIDANFYTFVGYTVRIQPNLCERMIKELNKLKSINQLSSI